MIEKDFYIPSWYEKEIVSRETINNLKHYHALLVKWQQAINLISPNTLDTAWERHFIDSMQIIPHIENTENTTMVDMGSGGGFPALVIAIMCPLVTVHLIESDMRKSQFLKTVVRECNLANATVHNETIDNVTDIKATLVTARALASLDKLLDWAGLFLDKTQQEAKAVFLKGASWQSEWDSIKSDYNRWALRAFRSQTDEQAAILVFEQREDNE